MEKIPKDFTTTTKDWETAFFQKQEQELLEKIRETARQEEEQKTLSTQIGIADEKVVQDLMTVGIKADTVVVLYFIPLVMVAWADGEVQAGENQTILKVAEEKGIKQDSPAYGLLTEWLSRDPSSALFPAWKNYVQGLKESLDGATFETMKKDILEKCTAVAGAAGGILGMAKISGEEKQVIANLETAFG